MAKEYNLRLFILRLYELTETQITDLKVETSSYVVFPSLFLFELDEDTNKSVAYNISGLKDLKDLVITGNYY